ncbi:MAG TPA: RecT family recombinase [Pseudogracilibacillus sp.]|nr:RecT family recombinase [Pseudogracilibacillus sp.]
MTNQSVAVIQRDITDDVSSKIEELQEGGLVIPENYNYANALKSAFFALENVKDRQQRPALQVCSKSSIANTLLDMVTQGLSPAKTQCYFIVYGDQLQLNRSYFGTQAVLKRLSKVKDIWANVIFDGDVFDYEIDGGREKLVKHETNFLNRDNPILGAYAVVKTSEDEEILTVMTMKEITASWSQAKTKNVQNKFPQEMAKRTVINRAAKAFINTSHDDDNLIQAINNSTADEYENERRDITPEENQAHIEENANQEIIDIDDSPKETETLEEKQEVIDAEDTQKEEQTREEKKQASQAELGLDF